MTAEAVRGQSSISNRTLIKTMTLWGWKEGATSNGKTTMHSPSGLTVHVASADSHSGNEREVFNKIVEAMSMTWQRFMQPMTEQAIASLELFQTLTPQRQGAIWRSGGLAAATDLDFVNGQLELQRLDEQEQQRRRIKPVATAAQPQLTVVEEPEPEPEPERPKRVIKNRGALKRIGTYCAQRPGVVISRDDICEAFPEYDRFLVGNTLRLLHEQGALERLATLVYQVPAMPDAAVKTPTLEPAPADHPHDEVWREVEDAFDVVFGTHLSYRQYREHSTEIDDWMRFTYNLKTSFSKED